MNESEFELAQKLEQLQIDEGIKRVLGQIKPPPPNFDGCCVKCGDEIPEKRLNIGAVTCLNCQQIIERKSRSTYGT